MRVGYQIADLAGGLYLALACSGAVIRALKSGIGSVAQISLLDCQLALLTWQAQNYFVSGREPTRLGARHPIIAPNDIYPCADGRFLAISPTGENFWRAMCQAIGRVDLIDDARFQTLELRVKNVAALTCILKEVFAHAPVDEWVQRLFDARVAAGAVNSVSDAVNQPLAKLREMVDKVPHPSTGEELRFLGNPFKYKGSQCLSYPPALGAHTRSVLGRICNYSDDRIDALVDSGVIVATPREKPIPMSTHPSA